KLHMHRTSLPSPRRRATLRPSTRYYDSTSCANEVHEREAGRRNTRRVGENDPHLDRQTPTTRRAGRPALRNQDQGGGHPWTRIFRMRLFIAGYMALTVTLFIMAAIGTASAESLPTWPFLLHFLLTGACVLHVCNDD